MIGPPGLRSGATSGMGPPCLTAGLVSGATSTIASPGFPLGFTAGATSTIGRPYLVSGRVSGATSTMTSPGLPAAFTFGATSTIGPPYLVSGRVSGATSTITSPGLPAALTFGATSTIGSPVSARGSHIRRDFDDHISGSARGGGGGASHSVQPRRLGRHTWCRDVVSGATSTITSPGLPAAFTFGATSTIGPPRLARGSSPGRLRQSDLLVCPKAWQVEKRSRACSSVPCRRSLDRPLQRELLAKKLRPKSGVSQPSEDTIDHMPIDSDRTAF